jgi:hypothetical protein
MAKRRSAGAVLGIDPGDERSAFVIFDGKRVLDHGIDTNSMLLAYLKRGGLRADHMAIEMIASYGMPVGREVFDTCVWIGRFIEAWPGMYTQVYRREVKMYLCGRTAAKDANVRQALIDRFGPGRQRAIGKASAPGPLYGITEDQWSALGVAVTWAARGAAGPAS